MFDTNTFLPTLAETYAIERAREDALGAAGGLLDDEPRLARVLSDEDLGAEWLADWLQGHCVAPDAALERDLRAALARAGWVSDFPLAGDDGSSQLGFAIVPQARERG